MTLLDLETNFRRSPSSDGVVQTQGRRNPDVPRRRWESLAVFAVFTGLYVWIGEWLVQGAHVVSFVTLDQLNRTLMIWHNSPPKLSAVGFNYPPLSTLLMSPLTIVAPWARSLVIVPLVSAPFAAYLMVSVNTLMRRVAVPGLLRAGVLVGLGCNPLFAFYASDGASDLVALSLTVAAVSCLLTWYLTADIRFVLLSGLTFAVAGLAGYQSLVWFAVSFVGVSVVLSRNGAREEEIEGTSVGLAAPAVYALALWVGFSLLLTHRPFGWIPRFPSDGISFGATVTDTGRLVLDGAPLAIVVLPALVVVGLARRDSLALWCAALVAGAIIAPGASSLLHLTASPLAMRDALPILLFAIVGALWLARSLAGSRLTVVGLLIVALVASVPWTYSQMRTFPRQNLESAFTSALSSGASQEGSRTKNGEVVGIDTEKAMAGWIRAHVHGVDQILTDNAQTYAVMLLTGDPGLFLDRVDKSDGPWMRVADAPAHTVRYLLLSRHNTQDLLTQTYPAAANGTDPSLPVAFADARYTLVRVPADYVRPVTGTPDQTTSGGTR
ncbi:hypothetical protein [Jatrophihabitans sp.]|uniref:hypothetical protein n=1 Tax=Jatrophihabitans sp. TaxID=1932789 RepID=UPI0030C77A01|nr:hypothetical protein [Jatrophihabitans sp.]